MLRGWIYIMTDEPNGTLYIGVTSDLPRRAWEHREGLIEGFTKRYGLTRLVFFERHDDIGAAIRREKNLKRWLRAWKGWTSRHCPRQHAAWVPAGSP